MAKKSYPSREERMKDLNQRLEQGIRDVFESERFRDYLAVMSRFHNLLRIDNTLADIHSRMEGVQVRLSNLREQLAAAKKELGKPFPQEAELAAKSARLAELNAQLDMGAQRKPASRERGMVKSSRPSVLEGLKRPAPPRTAEKKHQEEVR